MVIDIGGTFQYVTTDVGGYGEGLLTKPKSGDQMSKANLLLNSDYPPRQ